MNLAAGTRLGPYEIHGLLGAGGMGEVYRARDTRLGREVAVKVLPRSMASDPERQQRFEAEARAAGALNHPNIITLHDVGVADGVPHLVTEVLEGESLRALIQRGPVPVSRAIGLIVQLANGLAAAHGKGIVHRDLKPENLFVLADGRLKILDFGIAKLTRSDSSEGAGVDAETTPVFASLTVAGTIMGTVSYMAPEQLRDRPVDQRADLFAVGAILHELLTGTQPFTGETAADRVSSILMADAPRLPAHVEREIPGIGAVVARLLAKRPEQRLGTAADLAFTLSLLHDRPVPPEAGGERAASGVPAPPPIEFRQLTFRDGSIGTARFAPDGQTVVYNAAWGGAPSEVYLTRVESPESSALGIQGAEVQSVSATAEVALTLRNRDIGGFVQLGTLSRVPLVGGRPREVVDSVYFADWSPDGRSLAAIRLVQGTFQIEAPLGRVVHTTHAWISHLRYSPDGAMLAFLEHPALGDNAGHVCVLRPGEPPRRLTGRYHMVWRLAWKPDGREVLFGGQGETGMPGIYAVSLDGAVRCAYGAPGWPAIEDVAKNGDALIGMVRPRMRLETGTRTGGLSSVKDLSWLDWTLLRDLSADGDTVAFDETGLGSGGNAGVFIRPTGGGPAVRLADGVCSRISPDGRYVLVVHQEDLTVLQLVPTGAGETRRLDLGDCSINHADWIPGSDSVLVVGSMPNQPRRLYRVEVVSGTIRPVNDDVSVLGTGASVSPDGNQVALRDPDGGVRIARLDDGSVRRVPGFGGTARVAGWTEDSRRIYVSFAGEIPCRVLRVEIETGATEPWMEIWPMVRSGVDGLNTVRMSADGERYACSYPMVDSTLFLARGLT
ncbi:MAG TPA: protein kinase [Acidobacteriota bacterium]|nr:protein kinase [Acidobacteriota bacterium]